MSNRSHYFDYIEDRLAHLALRIQIRGKLNLLDQHLHSENFYLHLLNRLFGWQLQNANAFKANVPAIDLIDLAGKLVVQVSATATKGKVEAALSKDLSSFAGFHFKFVSIAKDATALRANTYINPHRLAFDPKEDIYDIPTILRFVFALPPEDMYQIYSFVKKELGTVADPIRLESNLATVINLLACEDLGQDDSAGPPLPFAIDAKIAYNGLKAARVVIDDYNVHCGRVSRIYSEFDRAGRNRSLSVLATVRGIYVAHMADYSNDALFFKVVASVVEQIRCSTNFEPLPIEELELCANILVVDAFVRCKIFENPEGYLHVAS